MRYKRDEAFRFEFGEPVSAFFNIYEVNGNSVESSDGEAKLVDLSLSGMKIVTSLEIPISKEKHVKVYVRFTLNDHEYIIHGDLVWIDKQFDGYYYGVHFAINEEMQEELVEDLKVLGKSIAKNQD